jgi:OmpA-OmpF porin, OOP family
LKNVLAILFILTASAGHLHAQSSTAQHNVRGRKIQKINLGSNVNSSSSELSPIISSDGRLLYFTMGAGHQDNMGDSKLQDCYVSKREGDGWSQPANLGAPINSVGNDAISGVSPDGSVLFIKNFAHNTLNGLCFARYKRGGWSIDSIYIEGYSNSNPLSSQTINTNFTTIIFSAEMPDGYGGLDLYISRLVDASTFRYSAPQNLGPVINTVHDDFAPFLASDGQSLYFSSKGHRGFGDADMFIAKRLDDSWVNWTAPRNLGPELNTPGMDAYYSIPASGDVAYFSSANGNQRLDLYRVALSDDIRPNPVILVTGKVQSPSKKPLDASVVYASLKTGEVAATLQTNPMNGRFAVVLPYGEHYSVYANSSNYLPYSDNLDLESVSLYREIQTIITMDTVKVGSAVTLSNIFFATNEATLKPESTAELEKLQKLLSEHPNWVVQIEGHTDNVGTDDYNIALSKARAEAVVKYLVEHGIEPKKLSAIGYGAAQPVADNATPEGRQENRRVVFRILKT